MKKEIPKVYANKIDKRLENNNTYSTTRNSEEIKIEEKNEKKIYTKNINQKISEIFKSNRYVYKANVEITLKDKVIIKNIIGKNNNNLITIDNELIPIPSIIDIKYVD